MRMMVFYLFCLSLSFNCLAEVGIITTYVGPDLPRPGALATNQSIDYPSSVASDGGRQENGFPEGYLDIRA